MALGVNLIQTRSLRFPARKLVNDNDDMGGMNEFFNEALSLIPQDEVLALFFIKLEESNAFSSFLENVNPSDYENLTENLKVKLYIQKSYGNDKSFF